MFNKKGIIILLTLFTLLLFGCNSKKVKGIASEGTCNDLSKSFINSSAEAASSELSSEYLSSIKYEVSEVNKDEQTITLNLSIPDVASILTNVVHATVDANPHASYEELQEIAKRTLLESLSTETIERKAETIVLPLQKEDGTYHIIPTAEFQELIYGKLLRVYIEEFSKMKG